MAEFQEIAKHWKRMCEKYWRPTTCHGCPIAENERAYEACSDRDIDVAKMEELVTAWAADHPEPVYETWLEFIKRFETGGRKSDDDFIYWMAITSIPAEIAEKLGLEPKAGGET